MKLRLTNFDSNTYEDTEGTCELCMWTGMMDHPVYEFTDSYGDAHTVDGYTSDGWNLWSYDVNVPVFTRWLHDAEFKEPEELIEEDEDYHYLSDKRFWEEFLTRVLRDAEFFRNGEQLNEALDWALKADTLAS